MRGRWVFIAVCCACFYASAGFASRYDSVPKEIFGSDFGGGFEIWVLDKYDVYSFSGFSPGGSSDLPLSELEEMNSILKNIGPHQMVFIQGTSDGNDWYNGYRPKEQDRLDLSLAETRGQWILEYAKRTFPEIAGRINLLSPTLERKSRGAVVYVASYFGSGSFENLLKNNAAKSVSPDTNIYNQITQEFYIVYGTSPGLGVGFSYLSAGKMHFAVPTANLNFRNDNIGVSLYGGWKPVSAHGDSLGDRAQSIVGGKITVFSQSKMSFSFTVNSAWEVLRRNDRFMERAFGFGIGPDLNIGSERFVLSSNASLQALNLNRFGRKESWWDSGYGLSVSVQYFFE